MAFFGFGFGGFWKAACITLFLSQLSVALPVSELTAKTFDKVVDGSKNVLVS